MLLKSKTITAYKSGIWAEYYAAAFLRLKGYRILKYRHKTKVGEVDIIAKRGKVISFVEVKYRQDTMQALSAVSEKSQNRIRRAAEQYLLCKGDKESHSLDLQIRFDVIGITRNFKIRHIENAF